MAGCFPHSRQGGHTHLQVDLLKSRNGVTDTAWHKAAKAWGSSNTHQEHPGLLDFQEFLFHILHLKSIASGPRDKRKKKSWLVNCWHTQNPLLLTSLDHGKSSFSCSSLLYSLSSRTSSLAVSNSLKGCISLGSLDSGFLSNSWGQWVSLSPFQALAGQNTALTTEKSPRVPLLSPHSLTQNWQPRVTAGHQGRMIH